MNTSKLWIPCTFEDRRPLIIGNFLFIPNYYDKHSEFNFPSNIELFKNNNPVYVEYCSGNGQWVCERAKEYPMINWIAVEKRFDRAKKIYLRAEKNNLANLFTVFGDANIFCESYLLEDSITKVFINFPDPWPKKKHVKNRLIQTKFISDISISLKINEKIIIATDHKEYSSHIIKTFINHHSWSSALPDPYFITNLKDYGNSFFSNLFNNQGADIFYMNFQNIK